MNPEPIMKHIYILDAAQIFTLLFIMLGPLRLMGPFSKATKSLSQPEINSLAWKSMIIIAPLLITCGFVGQKLMANWNIPVPIVELTGGLMFVCVAFMMILYPPPEHETNTNAASLTPMRTALSMLLSPYGVATLIVLLASSHDTQGVFLIFAILLGVLLLNYLAMVFIKYLMGKVGATVLQLLGAILAVLQAALALTIIHVNLVILHSQI